MISELHNKIKSQNRLYASWHKYPYHNHIHWLFFLIVTLFFSYLISISIKKYDLISSYNNLFPSANAAVTYYPPSDAQGGWRTYVTPNTTPTATQKQQILSTTGVDWDKLKLAWDYLSPFGGAFLVIKNGWVVGNWGSPTTSYALNSISKSLTGATLARQFTLSAAGTGPNIGPDDFAYTHLASSWGNANPARKLIQVKHFMTHTSGLETDQGIGPASCTYFLQQPVSYPPGTDWAYSNADFLLASSMVHYVSGISMQNYFNQQISTPIGAKSSSYATVCGESNGGGGAHWDSPSLARLTYLLMKGGNWNGTQLISEPYISQLTHWAPFLASASSDPLSANYWNFVEGKKVSTYSWWSNHTGEVMGPTWPTDTICASGAAKEITCGSPSLDLLYVRLGNDPTIPAQDFFMTLASKITGSLVTSSPTPTPTPTLTPTPSTNPIAWWKFDSTSGTLAVDASGNGIHGIPTNGPLWTTGKLNNALSFDAKDDYVAVYSTSLLNNLANLTYSAWIYPKSNGEKGYGVIMKKGTGDPGTSKRLLTNKSNCPIGSVCIEWSVNSCTAGTKKVYIDGVEKTQMTANAWHFVAVTLDSGVGCQDDSAGPLVIGSWPNSSGGTFDGKIDDARVYNRALSSQEIIDLFNNVSPTPTATPTATPTPTVTPTSTPTPTPTLGVSMSALPLNGVAPLNVTLSATVTGTATGTVNYSFWWNCNDAGTSVSAVASICGSLPAPTPGSCVSNAVGAKCDAMANTTQSVANNYVSAGTNVAKVIAERGTATSSEARLMLTISPAPTPTATPTPTVTPTPTGTPIGWWKFDGGSGTLAIDSSGNGITGTLTNGPLWTTGKYNGGLSFDAKDDYVLMNSSSLLNNFSNLTYSAWIYPKSNGENGYGVIVKKGTGDPGTSKRFLTNKGSCPIGTVCLEWTVNSCTAGTKKTYVDGVQTSQMTPNAWHFVAVTLDGGVGCQDDSAGPLVVGSWPNGSGGNFDGVIDDVRVYNRALSSQEIIDLFNNTTP